MTPREILHQLKHLDRSSLQFPDQLASLLHTKGYKEAIPKLHDEEVVWLVKYLDDVLDTLDSDAAGPAFRKCLRELGRVCGARNRLPQSYILESSLSIPNKYPVASGGSGDVYEGSLNGSKVCVKRLRIYAGDESPGAKKTLHREAVMWKRLKHTNIVPLLGITLNPLQLVSAWMPGGELKEYIVRHPGTNRIKLILGIANGLNYLHSRNVVHGDLKGPNILVDDVGCPQITDFGLAMVAQNQDSIRSAQGDHGHTARWTAPEILGERGTYSKEADVFSFAMVMVEVFTGEVPFHPNLPPTAMLAILERKRPTRPTHPHLTVCLWQLMNSCWEHEPENRPEISVVLKTLCGSEPPILADWTLDDVFISSTSLRLAGSVDSGTTESPQSSKPPLGEDQEQTSGVDMPYSVDEGGDVGPDGGWNGQVTGNPQVTVEIPAPNEGDPHRSEGQGRERGTLTAQDLLRRETNQSAQSAHTPLPIDPQFDADQLRGSDFSYLSTSRPHESLVSPGDSHASEEKAGSARVCVNDFRTFTHCGSTDDAVVPGSLIRSQLDLRDPRRSQSQQVLGTKGSEDLSRDSYRASTLGSNSSTSASRHELGMGTKPDDQLQTDQLQGGAQALKDSPRYGHGDGKSHDSSGRTEHGGPQRDDSSPTFGASDGALNRTARAGLCGDTSGEESSKAPRSRKNREMWCRIKRMICCVSDENTSA